MPAHVTAFFHEPTFTVSYVLRDSDSTACAVIDPVLDFDAKSGRTATGFAERIAAHVEEQGLNVQWILETHVHADHLSAAPWLKSRLGGRTAIGVHVPEVQVVFGKLFNAGPDFVCDGSQFDHLLRDEDRFAVGGLDVRVMHTPGHTPACVTYVAGDCAFIGDTLFMPDYGTARCDFPGGDARRLFRSIQRILALPDETRLFLCHDYKAPGRDHFAWETTVRIQKETNIHLLAAPTEAEFAAMRDARDAKLDMPALLLPSVQVNMRAGEFPPAEENGIRYLKLPLDAV